MIWYAREALSKPVQYWTRLETHSFTHYIVRVFLIFKSWTAFSYATQYAEKKKNKKKLNDDICGGLPIQILATPDRA